MPGTPTVPWTRESELRDYLFANPEVLFDAPVERKHREFCVEGKFVDLLFDVGGVQHIVELKRNEITREAVGQVLEYYGRLRRLHPDQKYRVMLVAPRIPEYRRLPLEEFGIRCVEVPFPAENVASTVQVSETPAAQASKLKWAGDRAAVLAADTFAVERLAWEGFIPPATAETLRLSHKLLLDSLPFVQREFDRFEIRPVKMVHAKHPDTLCFRASDGNLDCIAPGVWWAFAFGMSEQMPKNDRPNISVNAYPWGLDFAVNAELKTSQRAMIDCIKAARGRFEALVHAHGSLELQLWLKLEHQPRFYHWLPVERVNAGSFDGASLLRKVDEWKQRFPAERQRWLEEVIAARKELSPGQKAHLERTNKEANLAIRLVNTIRPEDAMWQKPFNEQLETINYVYRSLRPLIEFFN